MRVAVIGTGIAGNAAAWTLSKRYPITVYDRELRPGGHSHTVTIDYDGTPVAVDIGFIVYNELNYPDLTALFAHLGVETVQSCMSFAVSTDAGRFEWKGGGNNWRETAQGLFAQAGNLLSPSYLRMLRDILTFNSQSVEDHAAGQLAGLTLGAYFADRNFAPRLLTDYLAPMGAAIWSARASEMLDFPAKNFVAFFSNHRLLQYDRPVWRTVKGGSGRYLEKMISAFRDQLRLGCAVTSIERTPHGVVRPRQSRPERPLRSRRDCFPQRSGAGHAVGCRCPRTRCARRHRLFAQHGQFASRCQLDAEAPARLGVVEFPALAARGERRQRRRRDLLDEPAAGHRSRQAAVRQPQSPVRACPRADVPQVYVRTSAI